MVPPHTDTHLVLLRGGVKKKEENLGQYPRWARLVLIKAELCRCSTHRARDLRSRGRGSRRGKNRNSGYWEIKNIIIANASADVSGDISADFSGLSIQDKSIV